MTRIIAGKNRGRKLIVPTGQDIRPTTDRMRERVFSMVMHARYPDLYGAKVADLFAGTGAMGLEALSRGADHVTFVEKSSESLKCLESNIKALDAAPSSTVLRTRATSLPPASEPFDIIFMDPPYRRDLVTPTLEHLLEQNWIGDATLIICELATDDTSDIPAPLTIIDERAQGQQRMLFLQRAQHTE
ncbi:DNA methyltransferase [Kordiimonas sediminis]|uniref:DNA methyltransferase n=1 Tax=Kordiimonas sediminis TaxID=1735581 RepID=A0A919E5W0_9PROT|nr:16S rRNA (guanine(966)-N(2))-methyltransferase RsmD [Kordiimonas sediminis]GHF17096.1 DNA methyltransferase [Kordiimonas sediminis]